MNDIEVPIARNPVTIFRRQFFLVFGLRLKADLICPMSLHFRGLKVMLSPIRIASAFLFCGLLLILPHAAGGNRLYTTEQAKDHVGEEASVIGVLEQVSRLYSGMEFLNFDGHYPNMPFSAVVFANDVLTVGDVHSLQGKKATVTGRITIYFGMPEIIIHSADQLHGS